LLVRLFRKANVARPVVSFGLYNVSVVVEQCPRYSAM
jgi:hypothetical protein